MIISKEGLLMTRTHAFIRYIFFCIFFAIGTGAMTLAILAEELNDYFQSRALLAKTLSDTKKIEFLTADYKAQLKQIENDPNILARLRHITFGEKLEAQDTVFPEASELNAASAVLSANDIGPKDQQGVPQWLQRCSHPKIRIGLFFAGAALVLLSFVFFGIPKPVIEATPE